MTNDNDDDADDGNFDDILGEILGASFRVTPSFDLDLAFGAALAAVEEHERGAHWLHQLLSEGLKLSRHLERRRRRASPALSGNC